MTTLYGRTSHDDITLPDALKSCVGALSQGSGAIALLYCPSKCRFAKLQSDATLIDAQAQAIDLQSVFEARIFNEQCELRWLNRTNGKGQAVIISTQKLASCLDQDLADWKAIATLDQTYLLWGEKTNTQIGDGWTRLATARIGPLDVPIVPFFGRRVQLKAMEYLAEVGDDGNVAVVEERLVKLEVLTQ